MPFWNQYQGLVLLVRAVYCCFKFLTLNIIQVFGNFGFYVILKGAVSPLSDPYINLPGTRFKSTTPEPSETIEVS